MVLTQNMQSYIQDLKSLSEISNFNYFNKKDEAFEKIYEKTQQMDVDLSNAKEIVQSLSKRELSVIQRYKSLADPIKTESLSQEGAYNLLMHNYENIDYDGDGYVETGIGKSIPMIPMEAPHAFREKFIASLKEMQKNGANDFEMMAATITTFGTYALMKNEQKRYEEDPTFKELLRQHGIDKIVVQTPSFDDSYILELKEKVEHPQGGAYYSPEFVQGMQKFFKAYATVSHRLRPSLENIAFQHKQNT